MSDRAVELALCILDHAQRAKRPIVRGTDSKNRLQMRAGLLPVSVFGSNGGQTAVCIHCLWREAECNLIFCFCTVEVLLFEHRVAEKSMCCGISRCDRRGSPKLAQRPIDVAATKVQIARGFVHTV